MWTLQITELHNHHWSVRWPASRTVDLLLEFQPGFFKRMLAERNHIADYRMLAVLADEKFLRFLALRAADDYRDLGQAFRRTRFDAGNLPGKLRVVPEGLLHEGIHIIF